MKKLSVLLLCMTVFSGLLFSQEQYGNIRGVVLDEEGEPLQGVAITLESEQYNPRSYITTEGGNFMFLNIPPGKYQIKCEMSGFKTYIQENIDIVVGFNVDLKVKMEIATLEEKVVVVAESPVVDMKKNRNIHHLHPGDAPGDSFSPGPLGHSSANPRFNHGQRECGGQRIRHSDGSYVTGWDVLE